MLLSDTVGFISGLPTQLVRAFRATLEEVTHADLLLHVLDASSPQVLPLATLLPPPPPSNFFTHPPSQTLLFHLPPLQVPLLSVASFMLGRRLTFRAADALF